MNIVGKIAENSTGRFAADVSQPQREPDVPAALSALQRELEGLQSALITLGGRLVCVSRQEPRKEAEEQPLRPMRMCPLSQMIEEITERIRVMRNATEEQIDILEL